MMRFLQRHWKAAVAVLLTVLAGYVAVAAFAVPKPKSDKPEDVAKFVASADFRKLSAEQQRAYADRMRPAPGTGRNEMRRRLEALSAGERQAMFRNMRDLHEKQQIEELKKYFKLSKAERERYLDEKIAEEDKRFAEFAARRAEREAQAKAAGTEQKNEPRQRPSEAQRAAFMKERIESTSPEVRAARQKYRNDMMARRKATGKSMPRPRGGGRPAV